MDIICPDIICVIMPSRTCVQATAPSWLAPQNSVSLAQAAFVKVHCLSCRHSRSKPTSRSFRHTGNLQFAAAGQEQSSSQDSEFQDLFCDHAAVLTIKDVGSDSRSGHAGHELNVTCYDWHQTYLAKRGLDLAEPTEPRQNNAKNNIFQ